MNARAIAEGDARSIARRRRARASIVGANHAYAGLVQRAHRRLPGPRLPGPVSPAYALGDRPARADQLHLSSVIEQRNGPAIAVGVRLAQLGRLATALEHDEAMAQHLARPRIGIDRIEAHGERSDRQRRTDELGAAQLAAVPGGQD